MKAFLFVTVCAFAVCIVSAEVGKECTKDDECDKGREKCLPKATTGTPATDATTEMPATDATTEGTMTDATTDTNTEKPKSRRKRDAVFNLGRLARYYKSLSADEDKVCQCADDYDLSNDGKSCRKPISEDDDFKCERDVDCEVIEKMPVSGYDDPNPKCTDKVCTCGNEKKNAFVATYEDGFVCVAPSKKDDELPCTQDEHCSFLEDEKSQTTAVCIDKLCECDDETYGDDEAVAFYPDDKTPQKCLRVLGGNCTATDQCSHIGHASCSDECKCDKDYKNDGLFKCKKDSGASTVAASIFLLVSSVWFGKFSC